jgi:hypothetical protein
MTTIQKPTAHRQRRWQRPVILHAVERARLRARRWKQWPTAETEGQP